MSIVAAIVLMLLGSIIYILKRKNWGGVCSLSFSEYWAIVGRRIGTSNNKTLLAE
jgi:hypothetical protein